MTTISTGTGGDTILVIHHWDTDGICSAAMLNLIKGPERFSNISAPIGDFTFDQRIKDSMRTDDEIFVVDLNLPHIMEEMDKSLTFIDHHHQPIIENDLVRQINPLLKDGDASGFPSATTVISDEYNHWDTFSVLGAVGDVGDKAFENDHVRKAMGTGDLSREEVSRMVTLIDSNYISMDQEGVEGAVNILLDNELKDLLEYRKWNEKVESIEKTIDKALNEIMEVNGYAYMMIESPYNIISKLARRATWEMGYPGAIVLNKGFNGKAQTYFRVNNETSEKLDIPGLIDDLKGIGVNAGGKKVVMGSIYSPELIEDVMARVERSAGIKGGLEW